MTLSTSAARTRVPLGAAVPSLVRWGLSSDADLVFRTLTTFGPRTERTLAVELGLRARRTADALAELRECGAAVATSDVGSTTRIWTGRRPDAVVAMLRSRRMHLVDRQAQIRSHHMVVRTLRDTLSLELPALALPGAAGVFADGLRYLPTRELARRRLGEVHDGPVHELLTMSTEQAVDATAAEAAAPLDQALHDQGGHLRLLDLPPADGDRLVSGHLFNGTTFQHRRMMDIPLKLLIVNRRISFLPADPGNLERGYIEVGHPTVNEALITLFQRHWTNAVTGDGDGVPFIRLSTREDGLVALLAAGHTDHSAAERLRISPRSVTNVMRTLMDRLGVENRFQLGLALGAMRVATPPSLNPPVDPAPASDQES